MFIKSVKPKLEKDQYDKDIESVFAFISVIYDDLE